jgi:hypothetical protein
MTQRWWPAWSILAGAAIAAIYTLTPLTVCVVAAAAVILPRLIARLPRSERDWVTAVVVVALLARLLALGVLFARNVPNHDDQFVGATTGDEAYAMARALRTRDILRGSTTGKYDFVVAFDEYGRNSYVTALTAAQVVFGPTPYAVRLLNTLLFTVAALLLFCLSCDAFGAAPARVGLVAVLFWPTLFAWSISLLKEPLYLFLGVLLLTSALGIVRDRSWRKRTIDIGVAIAAAVLMKDLRPSALLLAVGGLTLGFAAHAALASKQVLRAVAVAAAIALVAAASIPSVQRRIVGGLESAAKTHTGHVYTVGHSYKLLDAGFYLNPQTPAASTLTLTAEESARFVVRAIGSFVMVPAPWQLASTRELAYLPEQIAWYALVLLLPLGCVVGWRHDRLATCMLVAYVMPTAAGLALTNGNVGTLLRLRGLVIPYLVWIGALGVCHAVGTPGRNRHMRWIDENGRLFGRVNLFDAAVAACVAVLLPVAYGMFLLFRPAAPHISSVVRVPITAEERRIAGGSRLTAKLKVRGSGLRPMLRATIGDTQSLGFVFEDPNSADVLVPVVAPGTHDLVLYDGVQEVARLTKSVTIEATPPPRIPVIGTLIHLDKVAADAITLGALFPGGPADAVVALGPVRPDVAGRWQRQAEILLQCDADPNEEGCAVGGVPLNARPLPIVRLTGGSGAQLSFAVAETFPSAAPTKLAALVRFESEPELLNLIRSGDRDDCLDQRAATVVAPGSRRNGPRGAQLDVTLRLGADRGPEGWRYRTRVFKAGAPFTLTTDRYTVEGTVLNVSEEVGGQPNDRD